MGGTVSLWRVSQRTTRGRRSWDYLQPAKPAQNSSATLEEGFLNRSGRPEPSFLIQQWRRWTKSEATTPKDK